MTNLETVALVLATTHSIAAVAGPSGRPAGRFGWEKVFVSAVFAALPEGTFDTLADFQFWLTQQARDGRLVLARADLVGAMDPDAVRNSEWSHRGATYHFVLDSLAVAPY